MSDAQIRAVGAQQLLENETFHEAMNAVEADAVAALAAADLADPASLIRATADLQAVHRVRAYVQSLVTTGKVSARTPPAVA